MRPEILFQVNYRIEKITVVVWSSYKTHVHNRYNRKLDWLLCWLCWHNLDLSIWSIWSENGSSSNQAVIIYSTSRSTFLCFDYDNLRCIHHIKLKWQNKKIVQFSSSYQDKTDGIILRKFLMIISVIILPLSWRSL